MPEKIVEFGDRTELDVRIEALRQAKGDLAEAQVLYEWLRGDRDHPITSDRIEGDKSISMDLVAAGEDGSYQAIDSLPRKRGQHYLIEAIVAISRFSDIRELLMVLDISQIRELQEVLVMGSYFQWFGSLKTVSEKEVKIDADVYFYSGIKIISAHKCDRTMEGLKEGVPNMYAKIQALEGFSGFVLDTTPHKDEDSDGSADRFGVILNRENEK